VGRAMKPCPKIMTFQASDPAFGWIACFYVPSTKKREGGVTRWEKLPMLFTGRSAGQVTEMAEQWWEDVQQKEETSAAARQRKGE